jgi:hypothetical protein
MAWTAYSTVLRALQLCGAYAPGEVPEAAIGQIGLDSLNAMRASWNLQGVTCYGQRMLEITADGAASYTMGTGGDIVTRPVQVVAVQFSGGQPYTVERRTFEEVRGLGESGGDPAVYSIVLGDPARLWIYPQPSSGTIRVFDRTPFAELANLSDDMPDPPEYREAMEYGLALRLASIPGIGAGVSSSVAAIASQAWNSLVTRNAVNAIPRKHMHAAFGLSETGNGVPSC